MAIWWERLDAVLRLLQQRLGPQAAIVRAVWQILHRVRFAWLLAGMACFALFLAQGQEILASSFSSPADMLAFTVACMLAAASVWYSSRTLIRLMPPTEGESGKHPLVRWLRRHLPRILGALVLALPGIALGAISRRMPNGSLALLGSVVLINAAVAFYVAVIVRRRVVLPDQDAAAEHVSSLAQLSPPTQRFLLLMLALNALLPVFFAAWPLLPAQLHIAGASLVMLAVALVVVTGSLLIHAGDRSGLPLLLVLLTVGVLLSRCSVHHAVPTLLAPDVAQQQLKLDSYIAHRLDERLASCARHDCPPVPVVVVAAEGGGVRAAAWTALVLARIEKNLAELPKPQRFRDSLMAISGVSGGSLGAAVYVASDAEDPEQLTTKTRDFFGHDLLSPALGGMLFVDPLVALSPYPFKPTTIPDRGATFERTLEHAWSSANPGPTAGRFSQPLLHLWQADGADRPLLLMNTTVASTGERMIQSPLSLSETEFETVFTGALDANHCLRGLALPLSAAVHNSARFPYISPSGRWPDSSPDCIGLRVVDGGYFENSGTATAADLLTYLKRRYGHRIRPVLVQISNDPLPSSLAAKGNACGSGAPVEPLALTSRQLASGDYLLPQLLDPLVALYAGRSARGTQAKAHLRRLICADELWAGTYVEFSLYASEHSELPLHWSIAPATLGEIERQVHSIEANRKAMGTLVSVLRGDAPVSPAPIAMSPATTTEAALSTSPPSTANGTEASSADASAKPSAKHVERQMRMEQMSRVLALSESLRGISLAVFGGLAVLLFGSALQRPRETLGRLIFVWVVPAWICFATSIFYSFDIGQRYLALVVGRDPDPAKITALINRAFAHQIDFATTGFAFSGLWLASYFFWWMARSNTGDKT